MHAAPQLEFNFKISFCFSLLLFAWACVCTMNYGTNSLCYAHTAGRPWTCGLKSLGLYLSSDDVTEQVHTQQYDTWSFRYMEFQLKNEASSQ